jgi:hypothetical protein
MNEEQQNGEKKNADGDWGNWKKGSKDWGKWHKSRNDWKQDRLDSAGWGLFFIWGALVIVAEVTKFADNFDWWSGWGVFFVGAGIIALIQAIIRLIIPQFRRKWMGNLIGSGILFAIGFALGDWEGFSWFWVIILAIIGIAILTKVFTQKR